MSHFSRRFHQTYGISPRDWGSHARMASPKKATDLVLSTCGFVQPNCVVARSDSS